MADEELREAVRDYHEEILTDLKDARDRLLRILTQCKEKIGDSTIVRAKIRDREHMIKSPESLARKAASNGWEADEAFTKSPDVVRGRIVCNNTEDVYRFVEVIKTQLISEDDPEMHDYIENPQEGGYRGVHLRTRLRIGRPAPSQIVPVEIQIRTLLQDAWARLTHQDIYKQDAKLPTDLRGRSIDLATVLASADEIASRVRERVTEERVPPEQANLSVVSGEVLTYIYARKFGTNPPDYLIRSALERCEDFEHDTLEDLPRILDDNELREELNEIVTSRFPSQGLSPERFFEAAVIVMGESREAAVEFVSDRVESEWERVERIARDEVLAEVPSSLEAFVGELEAGRMRVDEIASLLGGKTHCVRCGADLIEPRGFEQAVLDHYGAEFTESSGNIERIIQQSYNAPDYEYTNYCAYCANKWRKTLEE